MTVISSHTTSASIDARLAMLGNRQAGAFSRRQGNKAGASDSALYHRAKIGRLDLPQPGVFVLAGHPRSWLQQVWIAHLAAGESSAVTHESAVRLHGVDLVPPEPVTLTIPHGGHAHLPGITIHQIDDLRPHRIVNLAGLPVSSPPRAAVELAATCGEKLLARVIDALVKENRTSYAGIGASFHEVLRPGKPGMVKLARVLDQRADGFVPSQSELEEAMFTAIAAAGLPDPIRQFPLPGRGDNRLKGLVDAAYPSERVLIEADGRRWHSRLDAMKADRERDVQAARAGFLTLRFVWEQIMWEPAEVCAAIADVLRSRTPAPKN